MMSEQNMNRPQVESAAAGSSGSFSPDRLRKLKIRVWTRALAAPFFFGALFFLPAGTLRYWQAWVYMAALLVPMAFAMTSLLKRDPGLLERRLRMKEKVTAQKKIIAFSNIFFLVAFLLPGFDRRFGWSTVPAGWVIAADIFMLAGYGLFLRVLRENSHLSRIIEVEKNQKVISTGPYAVVRHPMYAAVLIIYGCSPLALGSWWGLLLVLPIVGVLAARILNEEKVLAENLEGYRDYLARVRYRIIPGLW
jgi:protein-S-isoprenylcysteine O-methyltransferase Ste14